MSVLKSRSQLVTFRMDSQEYSDLRRACVKAGARSLSEFARQAVLTSIEFGPGKDSPQALVGDLGAVTRKLQEIYKPLTEAADVIARVLGDQRPNAERA